MPRNSRDRAIARLSARWLRRPDATPPLAKWLETRNLETVAALDLYQEYDEGLAERHSRLDAKPANWQVALNAHLQMRRSADV
jgi:hypothetical protein